ALGELEDLGVEREELDLERIARSDVAAGRAVWRAAFRGAGLEREQDPTGGVDGGRRAGPARREGPAECLRGRRDSRSGLVEERADERAIGFGEGGVER